MVIAEKRLLVVSSVFVLIVIGNRLVEARSSGRDVDEPKKGAGGIFGRNWGLSPGGRCKFDVNPQWRTIYISVHVSFSFITVHSGSVGSNSVSGTVRGVRNMCSQQ